MKRAGKEMSDFFLNRALQIQEPAKQNSYNYIVYLHYICEAHFGVPLHDQYVLNVNHIFFVYSVCDNSSVIYSIGGGTGSTVV